MSRLTSEFRASRNNIKNDEFPGLLYYAMVVIHDINHIFPRGFPYFYGSNLSSHNDKF